MVNLISGIFLVGALASGGVRAYSEGGNLSFAHVSIEDGLSQSTIFGMLQDRRGFLWFATEDGLNRFDGYQFRVYRHRPEDSSSISDNWISSIHEDKGGGLWIASRAGLDLFDPATARFIHYGAPAPGQEIWCIYEDSRGELWIGTDIGLIRLNRKTGEYRRFPVGSGAGEGIAVRAILEDRSHNLWLGTWGGGLGRFDLKSQTVQLLPQSPKATGWSRNIRALFQDRSGRVWVGTERGLGELDVRRRSLHRRPLASYAPSAQPYITTFFEDDSGYLWVGTWGSGVAVLDSGRNQVLRLRHDTSNPRSLSNDSVWSILEDRSGVLWIGTGTGGGLNKLVVTPRFLHYDASPTERLRLSNDLVWAIHQQVDGTLWVGTSGGLDRIHRTSGKVKHYRHRPEDPGSLSSSRVWAIAEDEGGGLWLGTHDAGLNRLDAVTGRIERFSLGEGNGSFGPNAIRALELDRQGRLWIGSHGGGLTRLDRQTGKLTHYRHDPKRSQSLSDDRVWAIHEDLRGLLWIGTDGGGLNHFDPETEVFIRYRHVPTDPATLGSDRVWAIEEDREGRIWLGTQGGGLNALRPNSNRFQRFTEETSGLPNNTVYGILEDDAGRLWLTTNRGISCLYPEQGRFLNFNNGIGFQSREFNFGAHHKGFGGEIFFGGINGLNSFFPERLLQSSDRVPEIAITGFYRFGQLASEYVSPRSEIRLSHRDNFFAFSFAVLDYADPRGNTYSYILDGVDREWRSTSAANRMASYTFVPPGDYTLRIAGGNGRGAWSPEGATVRIIISPAFWQRLWFWPVVCLSLIVSVSALAARQVLKRQEARRLLALSREQERRRLAGEIHDGPLQDIAALSYKIDDLYDQLPGREPPADSLSRLRSELGRIGSSLRSICKELLPPALDEFGLEAAMREHYDDVASARAVPEIEFIFESDGGGLPPPVKLQLFRIYQAALGNVVRHAEAAKVRVSLALSKRQTILEITDDGRGFTRPRDLVELARRKHFGLLGMEERASSIGGTLLIESGIGRGTAVRVVVAGTRWGRWELRKGRSNAKNTRSSG